MATINVKDAAGVTVALEKPLVPGRVLAADSRPVVWSIEDLAKLEEIRLALIALGGSTDGIEALIGTSNTTLSSILTGVATTLAKVPVAWTQPAWIDTNAASATQLLAAGLAVRALHVFNIHSSESFNLRFDGSDATATTGVPIAPGKGLSWEGYVPTGKISAYSVNASKAAVAYVV